MTATGAASCGARKWRLIEQAGVEQAGEMEPCGAVYMQRAGLTLAQAEAALGTF